MHLVGSQLAALNLCVGTAGVREGSRHCVDSQGASVPCCEWSPSPWARSYMSITSLVLLWTVRASDRIKINFNLLITWNSDAQARDKSHFMLLAKPQLCEEGMNSCWKKSCLLMLRLWSARKISHHCALAGWARPGSEFLNRHALSALPKA